MKDNAVHRLKTLEAKTMYLGEALKAHKHVKRAGWKDGKYVGIRPKADYPESSEDYLYYVNASTGIRKPWTPFHADIIADDWVEAQ